MKPAVVPTQKQIDMQLLADLAAWCRGDNNEMQGLSRKYIAERLDAIRSNMQEDTVNANSARKSHRL